MGTLSGEDEPISLSVGSFLGEDGPNFLSVSSSWVRINLFLCQWAVSQDLFPSQWDFSVRMCTLLIDVN